MDTSWGSYIRASELEDLLIFSVNFFIFQQNNLYAISRKLNTQRGEINSSEEGGKAPKSQTDV